MRSRFISQAKHEHGPARGVDLSWVSTADRLRRQTHLEEVLAVIPLHGRREILAVDVDTVMAAELCFIG